MRIFHRRSRPAAPTAPTATPTATPDLAAATAPAPVGAGGPVNGYALLETVAALPVSSWRYLWEPENVRHLGPMAQDWQAAFGFNQDPTSIPVVDGLGVTLVCVQALHRRVEELSAEVARLREAATVRSEPEGSSR
ncbi:tail fiber domain-containing protein [Streptacidiphilus sp. P02-A3a]|uniref:tail fiber domain-containing protein n=1 Tax=Streptacidiphilus sp. P02-A3a TaxID=2704468 RepID=UPI0015FAA5C5|nr:tail fiber domain-containing protein [Streptacidiphilus sp. P02-A3a]QMU67794.1 tail fiber domain-containing protein [Streptacidiphilus sp. P02-A3a]